MADDKFDPSKYLTKVSGNDYLEVKWRLLWLRTDHPDASIVTEMVERQANFAIFRATVSIPGRGNATGWGSEDVEDFGDFIEKAETKALGRALAALGFGTQFCDDFNEEGSVTDSPVKRPTKPAKARATPASPAMGDPSAQIIEPQIKAIRALLTKHFDKDEQAKCAWLVSVEPKALNEHATEIHLSPLNQGEASELIKVLNKGPQKREPVAAEQPALTEPEGKAFDKVNCEVCGGDDSEEALVTGLDGSKAHERCIGGKA